MIFVTTGVRSGTGFPTSVLVFSASFGRIFWMIANFSLAKSLRLIRERCVLRWRAAACRASVSSRSISGSSAIASFASLVNGIFVDATWTRTSAGPTGMPVPPFWSSP